MERWLPIPGYEGIYEASDLGAIRSLPRPGTRGGLMHTWINAGGYPTVGLRRDGQLVTWQVHKLIALTFIGECPEGELVRHRDGVHANVSAANLEYGTPGQNNLDTVRHGRNHNANKTHCVAGHDYAVHGAPRATGGRRCRQCKRDKQKRKAAAGGTTRGLRSNP
jgi:NUMOD4 motif/HNH endonuclease